MAEKTQLILTFHNHQPVGNFDFVIEEAYKKSYEPLLDTFYDFPLIKVNFHYSGFLLEWIEKNHPEHIEKLKEMVDRNQVEILQGAFYEPILSNIPERDAVSQIQLYQDYLKKLFSNISNGMWLAERVYEPYFLNIFKNTDIEFIFLDEYHFQNAGILENDLNGFYSIEQSDYSIFALPISKKLRYLMPYKDVDENINFIHTQKGNLLTIADDGEKFGLWPGTYEHVYNQHWLSLFLSHIEHSEIIETVHFSDIMNNRNFYKGNIAIPNSSYPEMGEWALDNKNLSILYQLKEKCGESIFIKGGYWNNFVRKYPEVNIMTKRMWEISETFKNLHPLKKRELFMAQCNCPYWHGVFGGVYTPHLRHAVFEHLIKQESRNNTKKMILKKHHLDVVNYDFKISNSNYIIYVSPIGGRIFEWDLLKTTRNIQSVMARHYEIYHDYIQNNQDNSPNSIHDHFYLKDKVVDFIYDNYERFSLNEFIVKDGITVKKLYKNAEIIKSFTKEFYNINVITNKLLFQSAKIERDITFEEDGLIIDNKKLPLNLIQQWNIAISSTNEFIHIEKENFSVDKLMEKNLTEFTLCDNVCSFCLHFSFKQAVKIFFYPIFTISNSANGIEQVFQGISINILPYIGEYTINLE